MDDRSTRTAVVGIGASAGGIDALERLFRHMPTDTGMAFVIVTHLSPDRESLLPEIIARFTKMPVSPSSRAEAHAQHRLCPARERPGRCERRRLQLRKLDPSRRERKPIDVFFSALAMDLGEYAAGIVLSGGDGDGALGVKAIKERGGITLAQTADGNGPAIQTCRRAPSQPGSWISPSPRRRWAPRSPSSPHRSACSTAWRMRRGTPPTTISKRPGRRSASSCAPSSATTSQATSRAPSCGGSSAACR